MTKELPSTCHCTKNEEPAEAEQKPVAWCVHPFDYGIGSKGVYAITQIASQAEAWKRKGWKVEPRCTKGGAA